MTLNREIYRALIGSTSVIDRAVTRAQKLYNKIIEEGGAQDDDVTWHRGTHSYYGSNVEVYWEVTWGYGGHAEGSYDIPVAALYDDTWEQEVTRLANAVIDNINKDTMERKALAERNQKAEYKRLKKVYG